MNKRRQKLQYILSDLLMSALSWTLFFIFRKTHIEPITFGEEIPVHLNQKYYLALLVLPVCWTMLHYLSGYYNDVFRKSRLGELGKTFVTTLLGSIILFFILMLDDAVSNYKHYYILFFAFFSIQFLLTYIPRLIITTSTVNKIHKRKIGFNTLIIGSNKKAIEIYNKIENQLEPSGNKFVGFLSIEKKHRYLLDKYLSHLGTIDEINEVIKKYEIEEIIIALEVTEHKEIEKILNKTYGNGLVIKVIPNMYDILSGKVKMNHIYGTPIIQISHHLLPTWQAHTKQILDILIALVALILFIPLILFLIIGIKISSKGPVFYTHERIGRFGKPFTLIKFRSMYADAEENGPALSSKNDNRITRFGRFMRKAKLDEIPNFINVLKGDMSLVGPRPERQYYIDQIIKKAPHYLHLQKVKPGITSWGQVKFGYAENVDEMIERLKFDILYIENMSLFVDLKIIIHTILTIIKGRNI